MNRLLSQPKIAYYSRKIPYAIMLSFFKVDFSDSRCYLTTCPATLGCNPDRSGLQYPAFGQSGL